MHHFKGLFIINDCVLNKGLQILFEDNHLIAVHKPAGITVQPEPGKPVSLEEEVKAYIKTRYNKPGSVFLGVIHRLDMPVSGVVLFARTSKALVRMNELFRSRKIRKIYTAIVEKVPNPPQARITHWLLRNDNKNITRAYPHAIEGGEKAELSYAVKTVSRNSVKLEIELHTGRKHQIRAQLAAIGCPIVGDVKYGAEKAISTGEIKLKSSSLFFLHPVTGLAMSIVDTIIDHE